MYTDRMILDVDDTALREAPLFACTEKLRGAYDSSQGAARCGQGAVIVEGNAHEYAQSGVVR